MTLSWVDCKVVLLRHAAMPHAFAHGPEFGTVYPHQLHYLSALTLLCNVTTQFTIEVQAHRRIHEACDLLFEP